MSTSRHIPVLLEETIKMLAVQPGGRYIDCTLGGGGHSAAILERSSPGGQLLGIDASPEAVVTAQTKLKGYADSIRIVNDNFVNLQAICMKYDFFPVHGILFDLGLSSFQLNGKGRGFSFQYDAPLDMRISTSQEITAADIVNNYSEAELADLIWAYGEESCSYKIARRIVNERPIRTTLQLAHLVEQTVGHRKRKIHPATKTFQALRIAVNHELEHLESALKQAVDLLGFGGRLVVISYHSLEDRIVKRFMQQEAKGCICPPSVPVCICEHSPSLKLINRRVIAPSESEVRLNPRSRSAKLRAADRVIVPDDSYETMASPRFFIGADARGWRKPALLKKIKVAFSLA